MTPDLRAWAESLGTRAVFLPLALAGLVTAFVMLVQSVAKLFDDRKS